MKFISFLSREWFMRLHRVYNNLQGHAAADSYGHSLRNFFRKLTDHRAVPLDEGILFVQSMIVKMESMGANRDEDQIKRE